MCQALNLILCVAVLVFLPSFDDGLFPFYRLWEMKGTEVTLLINKWLCFEPGADAQNLLQGIDSHN